MPKLFYLGPQTSYTDVAKELFKKEYNLCDYEDEERKTITAVANELSNLEDDNSFAVLPIENSIEGVVKESIDNISRIENNNIKIQAECIVPINHCLVSYAENISDIKTIVSHPQAVSQCFDYIYKTFGNNIEYKSESSTANSIKNLTPEDKTIAGIGSRYSAEFYNKPIIEENINDEKFNQTRFLLVGKKALKTNRDYKTSIYFATENKSGALCKILQILEKYHINMTHISSRPSKKILGEYTFYIDFDGKISDLKIAKAVFEILQNVKTFKHLGSYPVASKIM